jgi:hypothetical protein
MEGLLGHRGRRPRIIRCLIPQKKEVSFSLAGKLREEIEKVVPSVTSLIVRRGSKTGGEAGQVRGNLLWNRSLPVGEGLFSLTDQIHNRKKRGWLNQLSDG